MQIEHLDHLVLTVRDLDATVVFYEAIGFRHATFGDGRSALHFGQSKINLHVAGRELEPRAADPTPGSADLCFLVDALDGDGGALVTLAAAGIPVELGPVDRSGATGAIRSVYVRDPDRNLVELSVPVSRAG